MMLLTSLNIWLSKNKVTERVVVTGMGCISAAGSNVDEFNRNLFINDHAQLNTFDEVLFSGQNDNRKFIAAQVKPFDAKQFFPQKDLKILDRYAQFALISAEEAIKQANINFATINPHRCSVVHGTSIGGQETIENSYAQLFEQGKSRTHPFTVPKLLPSAASSQISMKYGIKGPTFSTSSACSSAGHAIAMATLMLRSNIIDIAIVGGAEACITQGNFYAWDGLRVLSPNGCRPFSLDRNGLVIGEGAGTLILEREEFAKARGANIYAELNGIGMTSDAHNAVQPLVEGAESAMKAALDDAKLTEESVDYINAHGSATTQNDLSESQAINTVFPSKPQVSSSKSFHGHVLGAGAAIEAITSILALTNQMTPPSPFRANKDPICDVELTGDKAQSHKIENVLSNSFAFGGLNVSLIFSKYANN